MEQPSTLNALQMLRLELLTFQAVHELGMAVKLFGGQVSKRILRRHKIEGDFQEGKVIEKRVMYVEDVVRRRINFQPVSRRPQAQKEGLHIAVRNPDGVVLVDEIVEGDFVSAGESHHILGLGAYKRFRDSF